MIRPSSLRGNVKYSQRRRHRAFSAALVVMLHVALVTVLLGQQYGAITTLNSAGQSSRDGSIQIAIYPSALARKSTPSPTSPSLALEPNRPLPIQNAISHPPASTSDGNASGAASAPQDDPSSPAPGPSGAIDLNVAADYQKRLLARIEPFRQYPADVGRERPVGTVEVLFALDRNGIVLGAWIKQSSGSAALDREAIATILRAQPLPPIPSELSDPLNVTLPIGFGTPS
ncbi:MAG TPA: TonB family protein [Rhizomicrobium sp.]|nr:TonB family protein [Rhizomicrobium sp.]